MIAALVTMAFLLGYSFWSLFRMNDAIAKFTSPEANPVAVDSFDDKRQALVDLKARLEAFRDECTAEPAREAVLATLG